MEMNHSRGNLSRIKFHSRLRKFAFLLEVVEQLTAIDKIENHIEFVVGLEGVMQLDNEGMLNFLQYALFRLRVCHLFSSNDCIFSKDFHGIDFIFILFLHLQNLLSNKERM